MMKVVVYLESSECYSGWQRENDERYDSALEKPYHKWKPLTVVNTTVQRPVIVTTYAIKNQRLDIWLENKK